MFLYYKVKKYQIVDLPFSKHINDKKTEIQILYYFAIIEDVNRVDKILLACSTKRRPIHVDPIDTQYICKFGLLKSTQ